MKRQFTEWINDEHIINAFEINGEDNYALIDEKSNIVYGIGHDKDGLYLDFTWINRSNDIDTSDFIIVKISDNDYESIYHGKTVKIENYSTLI